MSTNPFSEQELETAAKENMCSLLQTFPDPEQCHHDFSAEFLNSMNTACQKARRKQAFRRFGQRAAAVLLICLLSASTWIAVDADARARIISWIRVQDETHLGYHFEGDLDPDSPALFERPKYRPTWIPEEFHEVSEGQVNDLYHADFGSHNKGKFQFGYALDAAGKEWTPETFKLALRKNEQAPAVMHDSGAVLYEYSNTNVLIWTSSDETVAFYIQAAFSSDVLFQIAESVVCINPDAPHDQPLYQLGTIPEGFALAYRNGDELSYDELYRNAEDDLFVFSYYYAHSGTAMGVDIPEHEAVYSSVAVHGCAGDYYEMLDPDEENFLFWVDDATGLAFSMSGPFDFEVMLSLADSIICNRPTQNE